MTATLKTFGGGELPQPAGLRSLSLFRDAKKLLGMDRPLPTMREATEELGTSRTVWMRGMPSEFYSREDLINSLRKFIPVDLVADDGMSWNIGNF